MAEYIDRKVLLNRIEAIKESADWDSQSKYVLFGIKEFINNAPAADVVEVVRCKDCRFRETNKCPTYHIDYRSEKESWELYYRDDFCSYGERKEKNNV